MREVRRQKGLPRRVVSELSGVSPRYLAQLEAGEGNISVALLERVAQALGVPIEALISRRLSVDPEVWRMTALLEQAPPDLRAQVMALLDAPRPAPGLRSGRICLLGLSGAGKTTLGAMLGAALDLPFVELGALVEKETGMPLVEVLSFYGADGFRRLEAEALERVIARQGPVLLTVSAGLAEQAAPYARLLERFHTVWLRASPAEHLARAQAKLPPPRDPALAMAQISSLMELCAPLSARAHAQVDTSGCSVEHSLRELVALCTQRRFLDNT